MKILLTGPSGRLGPHLVPTLRENFSVQTYDLSGQNADFEGDLSDLDGLRDAMRGCEVVVHLAATSDEAPFVEKLVGPNVVGVYNVLEAARLEKVRRVVFASSVQACGFAFRAEQIEVETDTIRPVTLYGATKVMAEAMGRFYSDKHDLEFVGLRIGAFQPYDSPWLREGKGKDLWLSPRDAAQIFVLAVQKPIEKYAVVNATSQTPRTLLSLQSAREILGYEPQDNADDFYIQ